MAWPSGSLRSKFEALQTQGRLRFDQVMQYAGCEFQSLQTALACPKWDYRTRAPRGLPLLPVDSTKSLISLFSRLKKTGQVSCAECNKAVIQAKSPANSRIGQRETCRHNVDTALQCIELVFKIGKIGPEYCLLCNPILTG